MKTKLVFGIIAVLAAAMAAPAQQFTLVGQQAARTENQQQRTLRLSQNVQHEAQAAAMLQRAAATPQVSGEPQINISCPSPLYVSDRGSNSIRVLCDPNNGGTALFQGTFYKSPNITFTALAPFGNLLYAMSDAGTIYTFSDSLSRGIADPGYVEYPGLAYSEHIIPMCCNYVYSEDSGHGRLFQYALKGDAASSQSQGLPKLGGNIHNTMLNNGSFYAIDSAQDALVKLTIGTSKSQVIGTAQRLTSFAIDQAGYMFVLIAGQCDSQPPSVGPTQQQTCQAPELDMIQSANLHSNNTGTVILAAPNTGLLDVWYSFSSHSMYADNGKLYVVSLVRYPDGTTKQQILLYRYSATNQGMSIGAPTVFAGPEMFGEYPFLGSLTSFSGGPIAMPLP